MELKKLGQLVNWVDNRNKGLQSTNLLGISIDKFFMPSVANIIGTDLSSYKVISENQFACNPMHVGRDEKMPVSLYMQKECSIVSPAYFVFEVADVNEILPEYLMLWFRRNEFDREVWFHTDGSVRGGILWEELCELIIPVPSLAEQQEIVDAYNDIERRIALKRKINDNLQQQAIALFQNTFPYGVEDDLPDGWRIASVGEIIELHDSRRIPLSGGERDKMENKIYPYYGATSLMDYVDNYIFDGIYLLLGEDGTVIDTKGYPVLQYVWGKFWVNNHAHILTGKLGFTVESLWVLFHLTSVRSIVTGAVQPKISQANLRSIRVVLPPQELLKSYNECIQPMFSTIRNNSSENERLSTLRDSLLPKLLNGEINVSEVEI